MEKAKIYSGINLIDVIDSVMLATAQEFYGLIEGTIGNEKVQSLVQTHPLADSNDIGDCVVKIVLWTSHASYMFIVDDSNPLTMLEQEYPPIFVEGVPPEWHNNHKQINFCFAIKNIIRTMMIDSSCMKTIDNSNGGRRFVAILVLDVVANVPRLIVLECTDYNNLESFYNDLNLCLLNLEDSFDFELSLTTPTQNSNTQQSTPPILNDQITLQPDQMAPLENLDSLNYITIMEIFENNDGYYQQVERDRSLFKFNRRCHHRIRITFINTNEQLHNFVFQECEKFTVQLPNENVVPMTNIFFVHGRDDKRSFYLTADWALNDADLYNLVENCENRRIRLKLNLYLTSKPVVGVFCYSLELDLTYKTTLDRLLPLSHQPMSYRITLNLEGCDKTTLNICSANKNDANSKATDQIDCSMNTTSLSSLSVPTPHLKLIKQTFINLINPILRNKIANRLTILFEVPQKGFFGNLFDNVCESDDETNYTGNFESTYSKIPSAIKSEWASIFEQWKDTRIVPPSAMNLIETYGVFPEIRKQFWLLCSEAHEHLGELTPIYEDLVTKSSSYEKIISWDVRRTFPSHPFFKNPSDPGQTTLYNVCKAYSLYDPEVGYCQGMSFIIASLLLVANEIETFAITVQIMHKYSQRHIYMENFQSLQLEFFIFERLLHKFCPELHNHLKNCGIEYHMFLTQWILTMFSAKFPLSMTFPVIDFFLLDGRLALIKISLSLLMTTKHDILKCNFDDILRYFRLNLPRFYISKVNCQNLINFARNLDVNSEEVDMLTDDYNRQKSENAKPNDPIEGLKAEKNVLFNRLIRMEIENDILARELIKYQLKNEKQVASMEQIIDDKDSEIRFMLNEIDNCHVLIQKYSAEESFIKDNLRKCINESDTQLSKNAQIIEHYKSICNNMEVRLVKMEAENGSLVNELKQHEAHCDNCKKVFASLAPNTYSTSTDVPSPIPQIESAVASEERIKQLEKEVVLTKDALAQASNTINELSQEITGLRIDSKTPWFKKLTSNLKNKNSY